MYLNDIDILGLPLEEGLQILEDNFNDLEIEIKKTFAWNKCDNNHLNQARVLKTLKHKDKLTIIIGYF